MSLERTSNTSWTSPSGNFRRDAPFNGLGIGPGVVAGGALTLVAIGYLFNSWLSDSKVDWSDNVTFKQIAKQLHGNLLQVQCAAVGSNVDVRDLNGALVCAAGTKSVCKPDAALYGRWRTFLGNYAAFFRESMGRLLGPNDSDGVLLQGYVDQANKFVREFSQSCPAVKNDIYVQPTPVNPDSGSGVPWGLILGVGAGAVAVLALLRTPAAPIVIQTSERLERGARGAGRQIRDAF